MSSSSETITDEDDINNPYSDLFGKPEKKETSEETEKDEVDYKSVTDYLISEGIFRDFEGREEFEFTEESFKKLWEVQVNNLASVKLQEEREELGDFYNQIVDFHKNGGDVKEFINSFTQETDYSSIDISSESGQEKIIKEYYKAIGKSDKWISNFIDKTKDDGEEAFLAEAEDCKNNLVAEISEQRQAMLKEQEEIAQNRKIQIEKFNKATRAAIYEDDSLVARDKKDLEKFIYEYKYTDDQGRKYSEFNVKINEIQGDPKKYAKFIKLIKNFDTVEDKKQAVKEERKETFKFLKKGGNPLANVSSKEPEKVKRDPSFVPPLKLI